MPAEVKEPDHMVNDAGDKASLAIQELDHFLLMKRGCKGTPLAYLTRADGTPPAEADDLGWGQPSLDEELIRRARHGAYPPYMVDNLYLWSVLRAMFKEPSPGWAWILAFQRTRNGRAAYMALTDHYLGPVHRNRQTARGKCHDREVDV